MRALLLVLSSFLSTVCFGQPGFQANVQSFGQSNIAKNCAAYRTVVNAVTGDPVPLARVMGRGIGQASALTDSAGRWKLSNIACGRVSVMGSKPGFLSTALPAVLAGETLLTTSPDSPAHDVRLELTPQGVVTGKVIDEAGDPVPNAGVSVYTSRVVEGRRSFLPGPLSVANDLGEYRIAGLSAGKIILCAHAPPDLQAMEMGEGTISGDSCYPGPVDPGGTGAMSLPAGREARVDFTLARVPAAKIHGKVTGMPENAGVSLMVVPRNGTRAVGQGRPAQMQRDGTFEARGVAPGAWMLSVDYWEGGRRLLAHVPVDVSGGDVEGVSVHLESAFSITGTLRVDSPSGNAPTARQVNVNLHGMDPTSGGGAAQWDKNHSAFTINDAMPGSYQLVVNVQQPFYAKSATLGGRDMLNEAVPISQAAGPVEIVIRDDSGSVQGRVEDSNGEGVAAWVMVLQEGRQPRPVMTSPDGHFKFGGLAPGDYRVFARDDFTQVEYADPDWMRRNGGSGMAVTVTAGQAADVKLVRAKVPVD